MSLFKRSLIQQKVLFAVTVALVAAMAAGITVGAVLGSGSSSPTPDLVSAPPAATLTVTSTADSGAGSLRDAIANAASGDTVDFAVTGTIVLTSGHLFIGNDLNIIGPALET
jgi:hypothetical protein